LESRVLPGERDLDVATLDPKIPPPLALLPTVASGKPQLLKVGLAGNKEVIVRGPDQVLVQALLRR
jgi:hypothetical protein